MARVAFLLAAAMLCTGCAKRPPPPAPPPPPPPPPAQPAPEPPPPPPPPALCELDRDTGAGPPEAATWIALLLRGYDTETRRVTVPALDCTGAQVRWNGPALACEDGPGARTTLPDRPLASADVLTTPISPTRTLVWIPTIRFASGDALGPVALVESAGFRLRVLALGPLRAYPQHARLRLEALGEKKVLVAGGELCPSAEPASCVRAARVVPLRGDRFVPEPFLGTDGKCLSPAWLDLARQEERHGETRRERLELGASLSFDSAGLTVEEQVVIQDPGASPGGAPARTVHRAQSTRTVRWVADRLVVSGTPLWSRMTQGRAGVPR